MFKDKEKIKAILIKSIKFFIFVLILAFFCFIFSKDSQTLNYYLNRGTVLEYSISKNQEINKEKINDILLKSKITYSSVEEVENEFVEFDSENSLVEKRLIIALSVLPKKDRIEIFNSISDQIFSDYPESKLLVIRPLGQLFNDKYSTFFNILAILILSFFVWALFIYLIFSENVIKNISKSCYNDSKNFLNDLWKNTKEKGIGYFFKKLLLDDYDDENPKNSNVTKEIISTVVFVLAALIIIRYFIGELRWIPSGSMIPTLLIKDRVYVEKLEYPHREIKRGDILVFYPPSTNLSNSPIALFARLTGILCKDIAYIKRVVALPNDKFEIKYSSKNQEYRVFINDKPLDEPYINSKYDWNPCEGEVKYCGPFVVPEGKYFMMGDNRGNSLDSRYWGFLDKDRIVGRAIFTFWPFSRVNKLNDKYLMLKEDKNSQKEFIINRY